MIFLNQMIKKIEQGSFASQTKLAEGDRLISVNGHEIIDVLDYKYYTYDEKLQIIAEDINGKTKKVKIKKPIGADIGLEFETYLMDKAHSCANRCIFCFVDQLPKGMRSTLYFKDDDARLSFLMGNYITLTNLLPREVQRIIDLHVSPIKVSVHSTDPQLRNKLLGNPNGGKGLEIMRRFAEAGITMDCQIVCCPGFNDGDALIKTMTDLTEMFPSVHSVSIVPVGLTKHREGLCSLTPFNRDTALKTVKDVESFGEECIKKFGSRIFFCADELYLKAGLDIPDDEFYEGYAQLENGVGLLRSLITEFRSGLNLAESAEYGQFSIATGVSAAPFLAKLIDEAKEKFPQLNGSVFPIRNDFFGTTIDVAGLVTGKDLIAQLKGKSLGERLLIPRTMLRHGEGVFLDDVTVQDVERELNVKLVDVDQDGFELLSAMLQVKL